MAKELGIMLIIAAIVAAFLYAKMILIWRDVMLEQNERRKKDMERLRELRSKQAKPVRQNDQTQEVCPVCGNLKYEDHRVCYDCFKEGKFKTN